MAKNILNLKFLVILVAIAALAGCGKKSETQALKDELAKMQDQVEYWKGKYDAQSEDLKNARATGRTLDTQLDTFKKDTISTTQEVQQLYTNQLEYIAYLESEIVKRDATIQSQQEILDQQEAALVDFMNMAGITVEEQAQADY